MRVIGRPQGCERQSASWMALSTPLRTAWRPCLVGLLMASGSLFPQLIFYLLATVAGCLHRRLDFSLAGAGLTRLVPNFMILPPGDPCPVLVATTRCSGICHSFLHIGHSRSHSTRLDSSGSMRPSSSHSQQPPSCRAMLSCEGDELSHRMHRPKALCLITCRHAISRHDPDAARSSRRAAKRSRSQARASAAALCQVGIWSSSVGNGAEASIVAMRLYSVRSSACAT
jgi:hypothetical protein